MRALANTRGLILIFLLGVIIGLGIGVVISVGDPAPASPSNDGEEQTEEESATSTQDNEEITERVEGENTLVVNSQPAGEVVIMSMVALDKSGWVAIREVSEEGEPGVILGAKRFDEGRHFGEHIPLLRGTVANQTYIAIVHADDGNSEFDFRREVPVRDADGEFIAEEFFVTPNVNQ